MAFAVSACAVIDVNHSAPIDPDVRWVLLPVINVSETPQAGERVEAILTTHMRAQGLPQFYVYDPYAAAPGSTAPVLELDDNQRFERALKWARSEGFVYGVTGTVVEWRYKSGLDGEPAVSVSIRVIEVKTGRVMWSSSGARAGWGKDTLGGTAQILLKEMVERMKFTHPLL